MRKVDVSVVLFAGVSILYPIVASVVVRYFGPGWVLAALIALIVARSSLGFARQTPATLTIGLVCVAAALLLVALYNRELSVRLYPAFMNASMLMSFALTLVRGPSMIERFARLIEPALPPSGVRYTRAVTWMWVLFFLINSLIAAWTAVYATWAQWTLYNGVIAYAAIGVLFVGEMLLRPFFRRAENEAP